MSKFRVGQRVKKVRGEMDIGITGTVLDFNPTDSDSSFDMRVTMDDSWTSTVGILHPPGTVGNVISDAWEPILDRPELSSWEEIKKLGIDVPAIADAITESEKTCAKS